MGVDLITLPYWQLSRKYIFLAENILIPAKPSVTDHEIKDSELVLSGLSFGTKVICIVPTRC